MTPVDAVSVNHANVVPMSIATQSTIASALVSNARLADLRFDIHKTSYIFFADRTADTLRSVGSKRRCYVRTDDCAFCKKPRFLAVGCPDKQFLYVSAAIRGYTLSVGTVCAAESASVPEATDF